MVRPGSNLRTAASKIGVITPGRTALGLNCPTFRNLRIPAGYVPTTDKWDAIDYLWAPFLAHPRNAAVEDGMDLDRILSDHTTTDVNGLFFTRLFSGTLGQALDETQQFGRHMWSLRWALSFLARFSDLIPNDGTCCPRARDKVQQALEHNTVDIWLQGMDGVFNGCRDAIGDSALETGNPPLFGFWTCGTTKLINSIPLSSKSASTAARIAMCAEYVDIQSYALDRTMYQAYLAWSYPRERTSLAGDANAAAYELACQDLGRLGIGALLTLARTILHEMLHIFYGTHCANGCCMQRLALKWLCNTASECGAWTMDANNVDSSLSGRSFNYQSTCRGKATFDGGCRMSMPGIPNRPEAWRKTDGICTTTSCPTVADWTNPSQCPTCP